MLNKLLYYVVLLPWKENSSAAECMLIRTLAHIINIFWQQLI